MLIISPRSYVTAAFDQLFPSLLEYVFDKLSPVKICNWWTDIVCEYKEDIFSNKDIQKKISKDEVPERYEAIFDYFDEYSLCVLVLFYTLKYFTDDDIKVFKRLYKIRNEWAHRDYGKEYREAYVYDDDASKRKWAEASIRDIREVAEFLETFDNELELSKGISILLFKMKCDWMGIEDNVKLCEYEDLLGWLYENVIEQVIDDNSPVCHKIKERVNNSYNNLKKFLSGPSSSASKSRYIVDYYWNAIKAKTEVYYEISKHDGVPTFESVVEEFTEFCYRTQ